MQENEAPRELDADRPDREGAEEGRGSTTSTSGRNLLEYDEVMDYPAEAEPTAPGRRSSTARNPPGDSCWEMPRRADQGPPLLRYGPTTTTAPASFAQYGRRRVRHRVRPGRLQGPRTTRRRSSSPQDRANPGGPRRFVQEVLDENLKPQRRTRRNLEVAGALPGGQPPGTGPQGRPTGS